MSCYYLCKSSLACNLKKGGGFGPLKEHLDTFCLGDNFVRCHHFEKFVAACAIKPRGCHGVTAATPSERRCSVRRKMEYPVTLSAYDSDGATMMSSDARIVVQTLDVSQGGMRVCGCGDVAKAGLLIFNFGKGFIAPYLHGLVDVCWHKAKQDGAYWEAGLSFQDQFAKAVIAMEMPV